MCDQAESRNWRSSAVKYRPSNRRWMKSRSSAAGPQISSTSSGSRRTEEFATDARAITVGKFKKSLEVT